MPTRHIRRGTALQALGPALPGVAPIYVDSDDNILKFVPAGSGNTEVQLIDASSVQTMTGKTITPVTAAYLIDGAIAVSSHTAVLTKATPGAYTLAAGADGAVIDLVNATSNAHVITGTNLFWAGVTGGPFNKVTLAAFPGLGGRLISYGGLWHVLSSGLGPLTVGD